MDPKKNDAVAEKYRSLGNNLYRKSEFFLALIAYNKVILKITWRRIEILIIVNFSVNLLCKLKGIIGIGLC